MGKVKVRISQETYELLIKAKGKLMAKKGRLVENDEVINKALTGLMQVENRESP